MAQQDQVFVPTSDGSVADEVSGDTPGPTESIPSRWRGLERLVRWMAWAAPASPELMGVTARELKVPR